MRADFSMVKMLLLRVGRGAVRRWKGEVERWRGEAVLKSDEQSRGKVSAVAGLGNTIAVAQQGSRGS